jgi:hypothetical protein
VAILARFVKLERLDPYRLFGSVLRRSRLAMAAAYDGAFDAHHRCTELVREHQLAKFDDQSSPFNAGFTNVPPPQRRSQEELDQMYLDAQAEDLQADYQASVVVMFADDTLQRFASGVLGKGPGLDPGFGPRYGGDVRLTTLLRAGTNAIRHVSEWDDSDFPFPYPDPSKPMKKRWRQPMESISVIQRAFGIGIHERIRDIVSMRILVAVDGKLGTEPTNYGRFESAIITAAREIAVEAERRGLNSGAVLRLEAAIL